MVESSFTFIEIIFVKTLITFKNRLGIQQISACIIFLLVGVILALVFGDIVRKTLELIFFVDDSHHKKFCKKVKFKDRYFYIPRGKSAFAITHSRILLVSRVIQFSIMTVFIHGCALSIIQSIGGFNISAFGIILLIAHAIKSPIGAGFLILANNEIRRGDILYFLNDKREFWMVKKIGWIKTTCNDVSDLVKFVSVKDIENQISKENTHHGGDIVYARQVTIPNTVFLSQRIGFYWYCANDIPKCKVTGFYSSRSGYSSQSNKYE